MADAYQLDIEGLSITITSTGESDKPSGKGKSKAKGQGIEILSNAKLRLKEGQRYALIGRNGTGKSSETHSTRKGANELTDVQRCSKPLPRSLFLELQKIPELLSCSKQS